jgi:hypothetical protein
MTDAEIGKSYSEWHCRQMLNNAGCGPMVLTVLLLFVVLFFSSCATKTRVEYVDREVVKYVTKVQHDTLINNTHDSIYHTVFQKGDTVYDTKYVEKTKYRDRIVYQTDTMYRDSIQTQIKETTVEKIKIPKWCYYSLAVCFIFIIFALRKLLKWL